jgi:5-methylcytosine-specific restriction endonuclease McrA
MLNLTCKTCGEVKPSDSFQQAPAYKTGYRPSCKACLKEKYPSKYQKKPPEYFEQRRMERDARLEAVKKLNAEIRKEKRDMEAPLREALAKAKKKAAEKARRKSVRSEPYGRRIEKINERCRGMGKLSNGIINELLIRQKCRCAHCGTDITEDRHVDHIIPTAMGGPNTDDNVQLLCPACNIAKGDTHPLLFKHGLTDVPEWLTPLYSVIP